MGLAGRPQVVVRPVVADLDAVATFATTEESVRLAKKPVGSAASSVRKAPLPTTGIHEPPA